MIEIISYQKHGKVQIQNGNKIEVERFEFCCWEAIHNWLHKFSGLNKCDKCEENKMQSIEELKEDFDKKVEELQNKCPHEKSTWCEKVWAIGHSCGYNVLVCDNCNKVLEENPSKEERDANPESQKELFKKLGRVTLNGM